MRQQPKLTDGQMNRVGALQRQAEWFNGFFMRQMIRLGREIEISNDR